MEEKSIGSQRDHELVVEEWLSKQSVNTKTPPTVSIVIPAYNEEYRLPPTLIQGIDYLEQASISYEMIVVDDGSKDGTSEMVERFQRIRPEIRLIRLPRNRGKGHAVKTGVLNSQGSLILFADADGSTPFSELARLIKAIKEHGVDVAFGSRALYDREVVVAAKWYRRVIGRIFNFVVNTLAVPDVKDTQCGFKLFTRNAAHKLFPRQLIDGYAFDVELLFLARKLGLNLEEVPVNWRSISGSKVNLLIDPLKMFFQIVLIRFRHRGKFMVDQVVHD